MQVSIRYDDYKVLYDAYRGAGGFKYGYYLLQHPRESVTKYERRKLMSYYSNYMRPIIGSHVDPIFREEPQRNWVTSKTFGIYQDNVDCTGTGMNRFMKRAATIAKRDGVVFIITDNFADLPLSLSGSLAERKLPYSYLITANKIQNYELNRFGQLTQLSYMEAAEDNDGNVTTGNTNTRTWSREGWSLREPGGKLIVNGDHGLGRLPVTLLYSNQVEKEDILPQSEFYDIARISMAMFNRCSELDEVLSNQAFSILTYPMGDGQQAKDLKAIITGTENMLAWDSATAKGSPAFIAPPSDPADSQMKQIDRLVTEMHRMARLSHATGVQKQESGVSKAYDFEQTNQGLSDYAANVEEAEEDMAKVFGLWANTDVEYEVAYSRDFGMLDIQQLLKDTDAALMLNIGAKFDAAVKKKCVAGYLGEIDSDDYDEIVAEIQAKADDADYAYKSMMILSSKNGMKTESLEQNVATDPTNPDSTAADGTAPVSTKPAPGTPGAIAADKIAKANGVPSKAAATKTTKSKKKTIRTNGNA